MSMEYSGKNTHLLQEQIHETHAGRLKKYLASIQDSLFVQYGMRAYIAITFVNFAIFCGTSWQIFLTNSDPARYQCYALTFWLGSAATQLLPALQCNFLHLTTAYAPFHMLPLEYPPLALLPFSFALLAPIAYYQLAFAILMSLVAGLLYWLLIRYGPRGSALIFAVYLFVGALATAQVRYDLVPATLTLLCIIAAERKHWTAAYVALAFGVLLKIYPILLLPPLFLAEQHARKRLLLPFSHLSFKETCTQILLDIRSMFHWYWKNLLLFCVIVGGITGVFAILNFQGAILDQLLYFAQRPVQIEATSSTFLYLSAHLGYPLQIVYTFGSLNILSPFDGIVSSLCLLLFFLGFVYTIYMQWCGKLDIAQASIALLLVFIATGKVFSPQYLIWVMPLLAYADASDPFWLVCWGLLSSITTFIYIDLYSKPVNPLQIPFVPGYFEAVTLRNALFVLVTLAYFFNWFQVRQRKHVPSTVSTEAQFALE